MPQCNPPLLTNRAKWLLHCHSDLCSQILWRCKNYINSAFHVWKLFILQARPQLQTRHPYIRTSSVMLLHSKVTTNSRVIYVPLFLIIQSCQPYQSSVLLMPFITILRRYSYHIKWFCVFSYLWTKSIYGHLSKQNNCYPENGLYLPIKDAYVLIHKVAISGQVTLFTPS